MTEQTTPDPKAMPLILGPTLGELQDMLEAALQTIFWDDGLEHLPRIATALERIAAALEVQQQPVAVDEDRAPDDWYYPPALSAYTRNALRHRQIPWWQAQSLTDWELADKRMSRKAVNEIRALS